MKKRALLALGLSVTLMFSNIVTVYAEEDTYSIETHSESEDSKTDNSSSSEDKQEVSGGGEEPGSSVQSAESGADDTPVTTSSRASENGNKSIGISGEGDTRTEVTGKVSAEGQNSSGVEASGNADIRVNGDVSANGENCKGVMGADKSTTTVTGEVTAEGTGSYGIWATGSGGVGTQAKGSTVNAGSVTAKGDKSTGIYAENYAEVTVEDDVKVSEGVTDIPADGPYVNPVVGVDASGNAHVTVKGNVTANGAGSVGVTVSESGYITVGGDITASGEKYVWNYGNDEQEVTGITADGGIITVKGNVTSTGTGILIRRTSKMVNSDVVVKGDVKGSSGIIINDNSGITVGGTVTATDGTGLTILLEDEQAHGDVTLGTLNVEKEGETGILLDVKNLKYIHTIDDIIKAMPEINVFEINVKDNAYLWVDDGDENDTISGTDISKEEAMETILKQKVNYMLRTDATSNATISLDKDKALENTKVTFYVKAADGYQVKGVSAGKATVIDNGDGSYSIIVPRGGGVNISAIIESVMREQQSKRSSKSTGKAPVPTRYATGQMQAQQLIQNMAQGGNCVVEADGLISFNRATFEALAARPDVSLTVIYKWNGVKYKVTIPAGYPVLDLLNTDGYCGCLYLNAIFGSEVAE